MQSRRRYGHYWIGRQDIEEPIGSWPNRVVGNVSNSLPPHSKVTTSRIWGSQAMEEGRAASFPWPAHQLLLFGPRTMTIHVHRWLQTQIDWLRNHIFLSLEHCAFMVGSLLVATLFLDTINIDVGLGNDPLAFQCTRLLSNWLLSGVRGQTVHTKTY